MKVLLFAGAGTSVELGVPSMSGLATEFMEHCHQWAVEPELVQEIIGEELDVEHLIEDLDRICGAAPALRKIGHEATDLARADTVRAEVEWFVQHAAERVTPKDAQLMWGSVLHAALTNDIAFVTTNYDRAIEIAANYEKNDLADGFGEFEDGETTRWIGFRNENAHSSLVKLHGSTDWFSDKSSRDPVKLRHPVALFGRSTLSLEGLELGSALVLPSREKLLTRAPFPRLSQSFLTQADHCDVALFVGSSLRDDHIRQCAQSIAERSSVFVVNPGTDSPAIKGAMAIPQHASTFLISTLPNVLNSCNPIELLNEASKSSERTEQGIFDLVKTIADSGVEANTRCHAIEVLCERQLTLAPKLIEELLNDRDVMLGRYALGLVPFSSSCETLVEMATSSAHVSDPGFQQELDILRKVVASRDRPDVAGIIKDAVAA